MTLYPGEGVCRSIPLCSKILVKAVVYLAADKTDK